MELHEQGEMEIMLILDTLLHYHGEVWILMESLDEMLRWEILY